MITLPLTELLQKFQEPDFYPHLVTAEKIDIIQTHSSAVVLTGDFAYKLKKAVNFGFLDYSTLDKRKYYLEQELSLNQKMSPEIYLEILPITRLESGTLKLNGQGEVVEYVLKMRQFPQSCLLLDMFEENRLTQRHLEELGRVVANFHQQTETNPEISRFGEIEIIKKAIDDNYELSKRYIDITQTQQYYQQTKEFTDHFFETHQEQFKQRVKDNKIKSCHGDLHLKNVCYWNDKILLFDRLEFNDSFRLVDVMYDIAFTVMDLDARGRQDFSNIFLNTYLEQTGDWQGLTVLPLYLSRQAYVRGKVNSLLLDDPNLPQTEKEAAKKSAIDYFRLAWEYTKPHQGKLILMSGLSGSGKTTVAREIAKQIGGIHIRSDAVRKHLAGITLDQKGSDELYTPQLNQKTYERLLELGQILISRGYAVILDAKYDRLQWRKSAIAVAQSYDIPFQIIHCTAPIETLQGRIDQREDDISDATSDLLLRQQETAEPFDDTETPHVVTLDTSGSDWLPYLTAHPI